MVITNKTCPRCHVVYSTKSGLNFHLNRKVPCTVIDKEVNDKPDDVVNILKKNVCYRCNNKFQTLQNLTNHLNKKKPCLFQIINNKDRQIPLTIEQLEMYNQQLIQELEHQKQINKQIQSKNATTTTNNTTNTNHNNNNDNRTTNHTTNHNHVHLHVSGSEDLSHITKEQWMHCFKMNHQSIEVLFRLKYFSKAKPENHNVFIDKIDTEHIHVLNSKGWEIKGRKPVIYKLYYNVKDNLRDIFEKMFYLEDGTEKIHENMTEDQKANQRNIIKMFRLFVFDDMDDELEDRVRKISCDAMEYDAYNHRHTPMQIQRIMETDN